MLICMQYVVSTGDIRMSKVQKYGSNDMLWVFIPQAQRKKLNLMPGDKVKVTITREKEEGGK